MAGQKNLARYVVGGATLIALLAAPPATADGGTSRNLRPLSGYVDANGTDGGEPGTPQDDIPFAPQRPQVTARPHQLQVAMTAPLQGAVEHSASLPPMEPNLRPGMPFDERYLPPLDTEEGWYWIPRWAAGMWHRDQVTQQGKIAFLKLHWLATDHVTTPEPWGWQMDKNGGIWHYWHVPYLEVHDLGQTVDLKLVRHYEAVAMTNEQCVLRLWASTIRVDKLSRQVVFVYQQEELDTIHLLSVGQEKQDGSDKWFDADGRPMKAVFRNDGFVANNTLVKQFAPIDNYKGKNMRTSFRAFLVSHGMANLVPDDLR